MVEDQIPQQTPEVASLVARLSPQVLIGGSLLVAIVLVIVLVLFNKKKTGSRGNALLLVGPSDAGKTAIFSKLVYSRSIPTNTSLQTNASVANITPSKAIRIVDIPGHPRIRGQFTEHMPEAKAIVFVVDSNTVSRNGVAVAEHLHHVLHAITSIPPSHAVPSLLIACNKADLLKTSAASGSSASLAINRVKTILERELEKRRVAQVGGVGVEGLGEEGEEGSTLCGLECGDANAPFRFDNWEGGEVVFVGTSTRPDAQASEKQGTSEKNEADGLDSLREWLEEQM